MANVPRRKTFTVPPADDAQETIAFELAWKQRDPKTGEEAARSREFRCLPRIPAGLVADHMAADTGSRVQTFIRAALEPAAQAEFEDLIRDKDALVDGETLSEIFIWLMEVYTGRNFSNPQDSSDGPPAAAEAS